MTRTAVVATSSVEHERAADKTDGDGAVVTVRVRKTPRNARFLKRVEEEGAILDIDFSSSPKRGRKRKRREEDASRDSENDDSRKRRREVASASEQQLCVSSVSKQVGIMALSFVLSLALRKIRRKFSSRVKNVARKGSRWGNIIAILVLMLLDKSVKRAQRGVVYPFLSSAYKLVRKLVARSEEK